MIKFSIYQGDTFGKKGYYRDPNKRLIDLTNIEFIAWVETPDKSFRYDLTVTKPDQSVDKGAINFTAASTASWPVGSMNLFVQQNVAGATETISSRFNVLEV